MKGMNELELLKKALSLLVKNEVLTIKEIETALSDGGMDSLWVLMNQKYFHHSKK